MRITGPQKIKLKLLSGDLFKTRTKSPPEKLYLSIKEKGIKDPLLVGHLKEKLEIVDGFQRLTIARELGFEEVPVLIIESATEQELDEIALLRNTLQSSLTPIEKAIYIKKLKDTYSYKNVDLASLLGVQKSYITELLSIFKLGEWPVKKLKQKHNFTVAHARIISHCDKLLQSRKRLKEIIRRIIEEKWSITHLNYELRRLGYLREENPRININGLFNRINSLFNRKSCRYTKTLEIHFDDLWDLKQKLTEVSRLTSRFAEFLPEEMKGKMETEEKIKEKKFTQ